MAIKTLAGQHVAIKRVTRGNIPERAVAVIKTLADNSPFFRDYPLVSLRDDSNGEEIRQALKAVLYEHRLCVLCMRSCMAEKSAAAVLCDTCKR